MGDQRRTFVFSDFLADLFCPEKYPKIADVGGGNASGTMALIRKGYAATLFEERQLNRRGRRRLSRGVKFTQCDIVEAHFTIGEYDLVIGMHPDGATWHIMRLAQEAHCPFVIVPCCKIPPNHLKVPRDLVWSEWLVCEARRMCFSVNSYLLPIHGKNLAIVGCLQ